MLGDRLKQIRLSMDMKKSDFSRYLGLPYTTYNGYESNQREPNDETLLKIARKLNVDVNYLLYSDKDLENLTVVLNQRYEFEKYYKELYGDDWESVVYSEEIDHEINEDSDFLTPETIERLKILTDLFYKLNPKGQKEAIKRTKELSNLLEYKKQD